MSTDQGQAFDIMRGYVPGSIGRIAELHGTYYHTHWDFGLYFETRVATDVSEFMVRYDDRRDGFWTVSVAGRVEGSIAIDACHADTSGAHLRWFIVSDALRGTGVGSRLMETALDHCRALAYPRVYLWTFEGLEAARHLYEKAGFSLVAQQPGTHWGVEVNEQRFERRLD